MSTGQEVLEAWVRFQTLSKEGRQNRGQVLARRLVRLCYESGVIWRDPSLGITFQINQELTPNEEAALARLLEALE